MSQRKEIHYTELPEVRNKVPKLGFYTDSISGLALDITTEPDVLPNPTFDEHVENLHTSMKMLEDVADELKLFQDVGISIGVRGADLSPTDTNRIKEQYRKAVDYCNQIQRQQQAINRKWNECRYLKQALIQAWETGDCKDL